MAKSHSNTAKSKPTLKLVKTKPAVRLGGGLPTEDMVPGKYLVLCEHSWLEPMGKAHRAVFQFRIVDGKHNGIGLRMWIDSAADAGGFISPIGKFARTCWIALGRELEDGDPVDEPGQIFSGRRFIVSVGYRKSQLPAGKGKQSPELAQIRKDADDYLRVHEIVSREDLP
jgi:hypothetical protein